MSSIKKEKNFVKEKELIDRFFSDIDYVMLDSRMVGRHQNQWHQFNIIHPVRVWQKRPRKNLGLVIEVEDEDRNKIQADKVFRLMNCSDGEMI